MDFEVCKENIQPLRGGRNRAQLQVALQAQADGELQKELLQNKQTFEHAIRSYEGDDPLDNWYNYISWIEQSFPKHGHEGNLLPLLEDCLGKFEHDERYFNDRRFCKLWIKYIDLQQNPDELFQLLHSKGIGTSYSDLYRAWAFYHEIVGDFKRANAVYQLGLQTLAQPYEELILAQKNMFMAAGKHMVQEEGYEEQLYEQRQALTSLRTYKHKHQTMVPSVRINHQVKKLTPGALPCTIKKANENNTILSIYSDENGESLLGAVGGFKSILDVARRQAIIKENTLKPGPWTVLKMKKKVIANNNQHVTSFEVYEDGSSPNNNKIESLENIKLYLGFVSTNLDDFSNWKIETFIAEPEDPKKIPMYPKHKVYCNKKEYSLEEIMARKYLNKASHSNVMLKKILTECQSINNIEPKLHSTESYNPDGLKSILKVKENVSAPTQQFTIFEDCNQIFNKQSNESNKIMLNKKSIISKDNPVIDESKPSCSNISACDENNVVKYISKPSFEIFSEDTNKDINNEKDVLKPTNSVYRSTERKSVHSKKKQSFHIFENEISNKKQEKTVEEHKNYIDKSSGAIKKQYSLPTSKPKSLFNFYTDDTSSSSIQIKEPVKCIQKSNYLDVSGNSQDSQTRKLKTPFPIFNAESNELMVSKNKTNTGSNILKCEKSGSTDGFKSPLENSIYKEENTSILTRNHNFSFSRDRMQTNNSEEFKEHVRSLLSMQHTSDLTEKIKINKNIP